MARNSEPDRNAGGRPESGQRTRGTGRARALFHRALAGRGSPETSEFKDTDVGRLLCATRMRLGKDLQQIAQVLHIRYNYLVAIEDGRYEDLPGQAYAIGFVRAYADHLELDGDEVVRRYKEDTTGLKRKAALEFPIPTPDSGVPTGLALLTALALGMGIYGVWYLITGSSHRSTALVQELPARLAPPIADVSPALPPPSPGDAGAENGEMAEDKAALGTPNESADAPPPADAAADDGPRDVIELRATADSWIQLREAEAALPPRFLRKGEVYRVPDRRGMSLMAGNAGGIEVLLNGQVMPPLGGAGTVTSGIALDAKHLRGED